MSRLLAFVLVLLAASPAAAHKPGDPPHQTYAMGDLKLESGEVIKDFAISYVTHGTLNPKKSNAILMVTALTGNHHRLDFLIGPGKALDTSKYFVVATDAIGNGLTTSPSNSRAQPRMQFPKFGMRDMVESQRRLLKDKLGIEHVVRAPFAPDQLREVVRRLLPNAESSIYKRATVPMEPIEEPAPSHGEVMLVIDGYDA